MYDKNSPDLRVLIQDVLNAGRLGSPVTFDGATLSSLVDLGVPGAAGWHFDAPSAVGGLVSSGVEATRAELSAAGFGAIAKHLPTYHVGLIWRDADPLYNNFAAADPNRFALPAPGEEQGLTIEQVQQIVDNVLQDDRNAFARAWMGRVTLDMGEAGKPDLAPVDFGNGQIGFPHQGSLIDSHWPDRTPVYLYQRIANSAGGYRLKALGLLPDHAVYGVGWNMRTDVNVNRYWRRLARSFGATINLEP